MENTTCALKVWQAVQVFGALLLRHSASTLLPIIPGSEGLWAGAGDACEGVCVLYQNRVLDFLITRSVRGNCAGGELPLGLF